MKSLNASINATAIIGYGSTVADGAVVGSSVHLKEHVRIGHGAVLLHCTIGDHCDVGAGCVLRGADTDHGPRLVLEQGVVMMAGSIVSEPVLIATGARIQAGAVVIRDVPPHAIVAGNPAQIVGYTLSAGSDTDTPVLSEVSAPTAPSSSATRVRGVTLHRLPKILDLRGNLSVGEFGRTVPFEPKRYFVVFDVPNAEIRGEHAHRVCKQFLICTQGRCSVVADDGIVREEFLLDDPSVGLYLPPLTWGVQYKYSPDAVLLVFASHYYDSSEYIRSYTEFRTLIQLTSPEALA